MSNKKTNKASGELDPGFGDAGKLFYQLPGSAHFNGTAVLQDDGLIVIAGAETGGDVVLVRYLPDGQRDVEFGDGGQVTLSIGPGRVALAAAPTIQPDGKVLVHGDLEDSVVFVLRTGSDGTIDSSFGNNGVVLIDLFQASERSRSLIVQADGKILLSGESWRGFDDYGALLIRLTASGQLDPSFGGTGIIRHFQMGFGPLLNFPDGRLLVGGRAKAYLLFKCFLDDGRLDSQFGNRGTLIVEIESAATSEVTGLALQDEGAVVAVGSALINSQLGPLVTRILVTGQVDRSFNNGHPVFDSFDGYSAQHLAVTVQPDGKILAAGGSTGTVDTANFTLMRFLPTGLLDREFGTEGRVMTDLGGFDQADSVFVLPDGKILLCGKVYVGPNGTGVGVTRYQGS